MRSAAQLRDVPRWKDLFPSSGSRGAGPPSFVRATLRPLLFVSALMGSLHSVALVSISPASAGVVVGTFLSICAFWLALLLPFRCFLVAQRGLSTAKRVSRASAFDVAGLTLLSIFAWAAAIIMSDGSLLTGSKPSTQYVLGLDVLQFHSVLSLTSLTPTLTLLGYSFTDSMRGWVTFRRPGRIGVSLLIAAIPLALITRNWMAEVTSPVVAGWMPSLLAMVALIFQAYLGNRKPEV